MPILTLVAAFAFGAALTTELNDTESATTAPKSFVCFIMILCYYEKKHLSIAVECAKIRHFVLKGHSMESPRICLTLTGSTLAENVAILEKYREYIDMAELRVDFLSDDEKLHARKFPAMAGLPCILTIRRSMDGGLFKEGEAARTILFARALSFADPDKKNNFEYVDFEDDFRISSLQEAVIAFGTKIIRSVHSMTEPVVNLRERLNQMSSTGFEIPKIAFMPQSLDDVRNLFEQAKSLTDNNHILLAMGPLGMPSRILGVKLKNYLTFTSPEESLKNLPTLSHMDPITLRTVYNFKNIKQDTAVYGITGWPLTYTSSPELHNKGFAEHDINAVYIPIRAENVSEAVAFADSVGIKGISVTVPHKEKVLNYVQAIDSRVKEIGASNTIVKRDDEWQAFNTDAPGFEKSLLEFTRLKNLRGKKIAIIGAGGAAKAIAYSIKKLHGKACIFNRTISKARLLAEQFGFKYASLGPESNKLLKKYSGIIIQTTSKGMNQSPPSTEQNDPLYFYDFTGRELLFDIIYVPASTPVMTRASQAGCRVCNGFNMLKYQGYEQFELFTGEKY